jgi:hypothetical protein
LYVPRSISQPKNSGGISSLVLVSFFMNTLDQELLARLSFKDRTIVERYISALQDRLPEIGENVGVVERENYLVVRVAIRHDDDIIELAEKMADVSTDLLLETGRLVVATGT